MRTTTKVVIWSATVLLGVGVWQFVGWADNRPSGVYPAVIVDVNGCGIGYFTPFCMTVVDMDGVRLRRDGDHGSVGDTVLIVQSGTRSWNAPTPSRMQKYREGR